MATPIFTLEQLTDSIVKDMQIVQHLFTKVPAGSFDYRPTPKQRSMLELLQYLAQNPVNSIEGAIAGDAKIVEATAEASRDITPENFVARLGANIEKVKALMATITPAMLTEQISMWGSEQPRGDRLMNALHKMYPAYKMQLFLYIKASGVEGINTMNLWSGVDGKMG